MSEVYEHGQLGSAKLLVGTPFVAPANKTCRSLQVIGTVPLVVSVEVKNPNHASLLTDPIPVGMTIICDHTELTVTAGVALCYVGEKTVEPVPVL